MRTLVRADGCGVARSTRPTADQQALLRTIIAARPCASGAEVDTLVTRLSELLSAAGNDPDGRPLAEVVVPTTCDPMP